MEPCRSRSRSRSRSFGRVKPQKLACIAVLGCVLVPLVVAFLNSTSHPMALLSLQLSIQASYVPLSTDKPINTQQLGIRVTDIPTETKENPAEAASTRVRTNLTELEEHQKFIQAAFKKVAEESPYSKLKQEENSTISDNRIDEESQYSNPTQEPDSMVSGGKVICDFTEPRSDTCSIYGDVRIVGSSSSLILASISQHNTSITNSSWTIRPYARKWESVMEHIKKLNLKLSSNSEEFPSCSTTHKVPVVVFSTGGFLGNFFHDFTDVVIPLFITSRQYRGEVQFLVTNFNSKWLKKYQPILTRLSRYEIINMDSDAKVHCFPEAHVGLISHKILGIDPTKSPNGYSMDDFRDFLRVSLSLKRETTNRHTRKPRLLILLRRGSRSLTNEREVIAMARRSGYKVIAARPEKMKNLSEFAGVVNSCDVMMGVHGAGLTNMVFLPTNATLIQIVPWGAITYGCRNDFGEPAADMGINYVEYEIREEESTLIQQYPRDHAVFKDPLSIHRKGFNYIWSIFLDQQKVKLDVRRFRSILTRLRQRLQQ